MSDNDTNLGTILIAFAAGAVIGAGIALLYAPQSGEETRRMLADRAEDLKRQAADKVQESKEYIRSKKDQINAAYEAGKEGYQEARTKGIKEQQSPLS